MNGTKENRQNLRVPVNLHVRIAVGKEKEFQEGYSRNLSETGMFVQTATPAEKGQRVKFEIVLRSKGGEKVMRGTGQVVWRRTTTDGIQQVRPPGMGIRFRVLDDASKTLVKTVVARYLAEHPEVKEPGEQVLKLAKESMQQSKNRRIAPRATAGMSALFRYEGESSPHHGHVINISSTGVFIRTQNPGTTGKAISFEIQLPNELGEVKGAGVVAWQAPMTLPGQRPRIPGIGVEFTTLDDESKNLLEQALSKHLLGIFDDSSASTATYSSTKAGLGAIPEKLASEEPAHVDVDLAEFSSEQAHVTKDEEHEDQVDLSLSIQMEVSSVKGGRAADLDGMALRKWVVNSLVASVEIAKLHEFANTETVQYLLTSWCQDFLKGTTVDLTMFWNMLLSETGVSVEEAAIPVSVFFAARHEHGIGMLMPEGFESLSHIKQVQLKAENFLRESEGFLKVVDKIACRQVEGVEDQIVTYEHHAHGLQKGNKTIKGHKGKSHAAHGSSQWKLIMAVIAMGLGLGCVGAVAMLVLQAKASQMDVSEYARVLILKDALRKADTLNAFVADKRWQDMTESERRDAVVELSDMLALDGIRRLTLFDDTGVVCVAVAPSDEGQRVILMGEEIYEQSGENLSDEEK